MSTFESNIAMVTVTAILLNPEIRICFEESSFLSDSIGLFPNMMIIKVYIFQNLITCYKKEEKCNVRISINRKFIILIQKMITLGVCVKFFLTVFHILLKPLFRRPCLLVFISMLLNFCFTPIFCDFEIEIFFVSCCTFPLLFCFRYFYFVDIFFLNFVLSFYLGFLCFCSLCFVIVLMIFLLSSSFLLLLILSSWQP